MTKDLAGNPPIRLKLVSATIERLKAAGRSRRGSGTIAARAAVAPGPDPVMIATLAIDHVGPATVRAVASGIEVRVTAPDEATAAVFRKNRILREHRWVALELYGTFRRSKEIAYERARRYEATRV
jgi:hypothetical protein